MRTADTTDTTKSVLGMIKTAARRPLGGMQTVWMLCRPTLDVLWFARLHREFNLRNRRASGCSCPFEVRPRAKVDTALGRAFLAAQQARKGGAQ